ncbi:MAG: hypothetical protein CSB55_07310 [Candidatus Cloacimonadota bacterium]|nr:MAG: hypothetical protein CSB55_07310 [Candidatus Cloacimonadota bacterium]
MGKTLNPDICGECHKIGDGCCLLKPEFTDYLFGLTPYEVRRIKAETGLDKAEFTDDNIVSEDFLRALLKTDKNMIKMFPDRRRIHLKIKNGQCVFLTDSGCQLSAETRPFYCKLYPFWYSEGRLILLKSSFCLAQKDAVSIYRIMRKLGAEEDELKEIYENFIKAAREI